MLQRENLNVKDSTKFLIFSSVTFVIHFLIVMVGLKIALHYSLLVSGFSCHFESFFDLDVKNISNLLFCIMSEMAGVLSTAVLFQ